MASGFFFYIKELRPSAGSRRIPRIPDALVHRRKVDRFRFPRLKSEGYNRHSGLCYTI